MVDFNSVLDFSHHNCVAICSILVPLNLLLTLQTLILTGLGRPKAQVWQSVGLAIACALVMVLHVLTWFVVGVVMIPTYVLLSLGFCCFCLNSWAVLHAASLSKLLKWVIHIVKQSLSLPIQGV